MQIVGAQTDVAQMITLVVANEQVDVLVVAQHTETPLNVKPSPAYFPEGLVLLASCT